MPQNPKKSKYKVKTLHQLRNGQTSQFGSLITLFTLLKAIANKNYLKAFNINIKSLMTLCKTYRSNLY